MLKGLRVPKIMKTMGCKDSQLIHRVQRRNFQGFKKGKDSWVEVEYFGHDGKWPQNYMQEIDNGPNFLLSEVTMKWKGSGGLGKEYIEPLEERKEVCFEGDI